MYIHFEIGEQLQLENTANRIVSGFFHAGGIRDLQLRVSLSLHTCRKDTFEQTLVESKRNRLHRDEIPFSNLEEPRLDLGAVQYRFCLRRGSLI